VAHKREIPSREQKGWKSIFSVAQKGTRFFSEPHKRFPQGKKQSGLEVEDMGSLGIR
jgi:hypothetical protein